MIGTRLLSEAQHPFISSSDNLHHCRNIFGPSTIRTSRLRMTGRYNTCKYSTLMSISPPGTKIQSKLNKLNIQTAASDMETILASWPEISGARNRQDSTLSMRGWSSTEQRSIKTSTPMRSCWWKKDTRVLPSSPSQSIISSSWEQLRPA